MLKKLLSVSLWLMVFAAGPLASATTLIYLSDRALYHTSDLIMTGQVIGQPESSIGSNGLIYSTISLSVEELIKGGANTTIQIKQLGGSMDGRRTVIPGMPQFHSGEKVLVFLRDKKHEGYEVIGMTQGKLNIKKDSVTGKNIVMKDIRTIQGVEFEYPKERIGFNKDLVKRKKGASVNPKGAKKEPVINRSKVHLLGKYIEELKAYGDPDRIEKLKHE